MRLQAFVRQKCIRYCRCRCHSKGSITTPNAVTGFIGRLSMRYGNIPLTRAPSCDYPSCRSSGRSSMQLNYIFPKWFMRRSLSISTYWDFVSGISIHLQIPRTCPNNHDLWHFIVYGNLPAIQRLLASGEVHPSDRDEHGISAVLESDCPVVPVL